MGTEAELYVVQVAGSPRLESSDWRYVEAGRTDYESGPAAETFDGGDFADSGEVLGYHPG